MELCKLRRPLSPSLDAGGQLSMVFGRPADHNHSSLDAAHHLGWVSLAAAIA
jgi:hypothetical protein